MDVKRVPISQINPATYNPRKDLQPSDSEYQKLKKSINEFGFLIPLVWNRQTGNLVGGHQRLKVLIAEGAKEVEVSVVDLPLDKEKALNLALNRIQGQWDQEKLANLLDELTKIPDFEVGLSGFDTFEVSKILDTIKDVKEEGFNFDEVVNSIEKPITKEGDIIGLGPHKILCGDSSDKKCLQKLFINEKANLLNTDFPYNVNYMGGDRPNPNTRPKKSRKWDKIYSDNLPQTEYEAWMKKILSNVKDFLYPGTAIYIWQGHRQFPPMYQILLDLDFHISCVLCWEKETFAISYADYSFQTEQCLYGWLKGANHYWAGANNETTLWKVKRDPTKSYQHPTQKPVELASRAIRNSSKRGDIILDTFLGSGSTLIAAESLSRRCFGLEIDPKYCDAIVRRYLAFVGKDKVSQEIKNKYL
jgi:DNA modification methylase